MKLLIVEDDCGLCLALSGYLKDRGYTSDFCHSGADASYYIGQGGYDVILLDRLLPERDAAAFSQEFTDLVTRLTASQVVDLRRLGSEERERSRLVGRVKRLAESENSSSQDIPSPVYLFRDGSGSRFCGSAHTFNTAGTVTTLIYVKRLERQNREIAVQGLFLLVCGIVSLAVLAVVSRLLTARALVPVRENAEKQSRFIAAASHELRSPLAVIEANSDLIGTKAPDMYEAYFPVCERQRHPLSIDLPEEALPSVRGDIDQLSQLFAILLDNALSHTPQGTEICLSVRPLHRGGLLFAVIDHGPGIPAGSREKIFDRFYRSDPSRSDKSHYGLGLSIARELAKAHGAKLYVKDTPGGGATFWVEFPC